MLLLNCEYAGLDSCENCRGLWVCITLDQIHSMAETAWDFRCRIIISENVMFHIIRVYVLTFSSPITMTWNNENRVFLVEYFIISFTSYYSVWTCLNFNKLINIQYICLHKINIIQFSTIDKQMYMYDNHVFELYSIMKPIHCCNPYIYLSVFLINSFFKGWVVIHGKVSNHYCTGSKWPDICGQ